MAASLCRRLYRELKPSLSRSLRGIPFNKARNLETRLRDLEKARGIIEIPPVNIGFSLPDKAFNKTINAQPTKLIDVQEVRSDWQTTNGMKQIKNIAFHYGIYRDLFNWAFFYPTTQLHVNYDDGNGLLTPICYGNQVKPVEMKSMPEIHFNSDPESLWTLIVTNLDCHFEKDSYEYLLWFVGNIRGNDVTTGDVICDYMQPFPAKGLGYQRVAYILYKQDQKVDYASIKRKEPCLSLKERTFKTSDFYNEHQSIITPVGLAFCQVDWDESMTDFFHKVLKMREPRFDYDHPPQYIKRQSWNPHKAKFDAYLDKYRPPKELAEEVLLMRLKNTDPFREREKEILPLVHRVPNNTSTWIKKQMRQQHLRHGKYRDL